jgi:hypothetical protein
LVGYRHDEDLIRFDGVQHCEWETRNEPLVHGGTNDRTGFRGGNDSARRLFDSVQKVPAEPLDSLSRIPTFLRAPPHGRRLSSSEGAACLCKSLIRGHPLGLAGTEFVEATRSASTSHRASTSGSISVSRLAMSSCARRARSLSDSFIALATISSNRVSMRFLQRWQRSRLREIRRTRCRSGAARPRPRLERLVRPARDAPFLPVLLDNST